MRPPAPQEQTDAREDTPLTEHGPPGNEQQRNFADYLGLAARGFCMGAADIVPGVSGGTMAFITGIYQELIDAIRSVDLVLVRLLLKLKFSEALERFPWKFVAWLLGGILTAIFLLSHFLKEQLQSNPDKVLAFFFGLVVASVVTVARRGMPWNPARLALAVAAAVAAFLLVGLMPAETPDHQWFVFLCGAIAFCALILPGISGSFMLLLLGKYSYVLDCVNGLKEGLRAGDVTQSFHSALPLVVLSAGGAVGLIAFSRLLGWLLREHYSATVAALTGLMVGSLRKIWPWKVNYFIEGERNVLPADTGSGFWIIIGLMLLGLLLVLAIEWAARLKTGQTGED